MVLTPVALTLMLLILSMGPISNFPENLEEAPNPKSITEIFNEYFSSIADDLGKNNKNDTHPDLSRLQDYINDKIPPDILIPYPTN